MENKKIYREIKVDSRINLYQLAKNIISSFDFYFDHCFGFFGYDNGRDYYDSIKKYELFTDLPDMEPTGAESVKKTKTDKVWMKIGDKMIFLFDYGDNWEFNIELIKIKDDPGNKKHPIVLSQSGKLEQYPPCE